MVTTYDYLWCHKLYYYVIIEQNQRKKLQDMTEQLITETEDNEKQLNELQWKQEALDKELLELKIKSQSEVEETIVKLEEERLMKELQPIILAVSKLHQQQHKLINRQRLFKALKFELHKGEKS